MMVILQKKFHRLHVDNLIKIKYEMLNQNATITARSDPIIHSIIFKNFFIVITLLLMSTYIQFFQ